LKNERTAAVISGVPTNFRPARWDSWPPSVRVSAQTIRASERIVPLKSSKRSSTDILTSGLRRPVVSTQTPPSPRLSRRRAKLTVV
jgi:hypothetical protein